MSERQPTGAANGADRLDESPSAGPATADAYVIPTALAQATLEYLGTRPYREVFALIRGFEQLQPSPGRRVEGTR